MKTKAYYTTDGSEYWKNKEGWFHRGDGPAVTYSDGSVYYFQNNKLHRLDGPAVIKAYKEEYFIEGEEYEKREYYKVLVKKGLMTFQEALPDLI